MSMAAPVRALDDSPKGSGSFGLPAGGAEPWFSFPDSAPAGVAARSRLSSLSKAMRAAASAAFLWPPLWEGDGALLPGGSLLFSARRCDSEAGSVISLNQGIFITALAVARLAGSMLRTLFISSICPGGIEAGYRFSSVCGGDAASGNCTLAKLELSIRSFICSAVRAPIILWITNSWSTSDSPGKSGRPSKISPAMHPSAHRSTLVP
mmetsp:Transcript_77064/g.202187  ORF Transcript_77064/g.202187 Transcript_77064/m.202187 type:complete len:208 (+) Transcript_77064:655-1278(+)